MRFLGHSALALLLLAAMSCVPHRGPESPELRLQRYEASMAQGSTFLAGSDFGRAARQFESAIRDVPDSAQGHALLGFAYLKLKRTDLAEQTLLKAVTLDPGNLTALCNLGAISAGNRNFGAARGYLERAVALDPGFPQAQYSLGNLLMYMGDIEKARQALDKAFELDPNLAMTVSQNIKGLPEDARSLDTYLSFARFFAMRGDAQETVRFLERARRLGFKHWAALLAEKDFDKVRGDAKVHPFLD
jgi:tetratricopeptide (TPR) repeat protein